jgi:hypothetical protein
VETVINHRVVGGRHIIAGISGGVWLDGDKGLAVTAAGKSSATALAKAKKQPAVSAGGKSVVWWWD